MNSPRCILGLVLSLVALSAVARAASAAPAAPAAAAPAAPKVLWTVTEGVDAPESAYFEPTSGHLFVSLIGGQPDAKDGNGRIARLTADGKVVSMSWATGLNAPKGLRSTGNTLWTADIDEIVGFDLATGRVTTRVKVPEAKFLNDVACGPDGTVYVSDMLASVIYALKDGKVSVFASGEQLEYPNGLLVDGDRLIVGGWGKPEADFSTKVPGRLLALNLRTKQLTRITPNPTANIDGLETDGHGGWYVSEWTSGKLLRIDAKGAMTTVAQFPSGTADIGFAHATHKLVIPHMSENKIVAYDLNQ